MKNEPRIVILIAFFYFVELREGEKGGETVVLVKKRPDSLESRAIGYERYM